MIRDQAVSLFAELPSDNISLRADYVGLSIGRALHRWRHFRIVKIMMIPILTRETSERLTGEDVDKREQFLNTLPRTSIVCHFLCHVARKPTGQDKETTGWQLT